MEDVEVMVYLLLCLWLFVRDHGVGFNAASSFIVRFKKSFDFREGVALRCR